MEFRIIKKSELDTRTGNIIPVYYVQRKRIYEYEVGFFGLKQLLKKDGKIVMDHII